jgi:hypothetical protein
VQFALFFFAAAAAAAAVIIEDFAFFGQLADRI